MCARMSEERGVPVWERAWSVEEMKKGAGEWSLASDAGVNIKLYMFISLTHSPQQYYE